jgi:hypothetical protein
MLSIYVLMHACIFLQVYSSTPGIFNSNEWILINENTPSKTSPPTPQTYLDQKESATIFISVSSFRDARCSVTLYNLFSKAKYPDRVFVGNCCH